MGSEIGSIKDRLSKGRERVRSLEDGGLDLSKVRSIIDDLDRKVDEAPEDKIRSGIDKLELYLDKMEEKLSKKKIRKKIVLKKEGKREKKQESAEEGEKGVHKEKREEEGPVADTDQDRERSEEEITAEVQKDRKGSEQGTDETSAAKKSSAEPSSEEGEVYPEESVPSDEEQGKGTEKEDSEPGFDEEKRSSDLKMISSYLDEIRDLEGDISGISSHMDVLERSFSERDAATFDEYFPLVKNWAEEYLLDLRRSLIDTLSESIQMMIDVHVAFDKGEEIGDVPAKVDQQLSGSEEADLPSLKERISNLSRIEEELRSGFEELKHEAKASLEKRMKELGVRLSDMEEEVYIEPYQNNLKIAREAVEKGEFIMASGTLDEMEKMMDDHEKAMKTKKLESILVSIEPMLERVMETRGEDSGDYREFLSQKQKVLEASRSDIDRSLEMVGDLLDHATTLVAELDEKRVEELERRIREQREIASKYSSIMDTGPVLRIIEKADIKLQEGTVEEASELMERASAAFENLRRKKDREETREKLKRYEAKVEEYKKAGLDVTPLNDPLTEAWNALDSDDPQVVAEHMKEIEAKLSYLRVEEMKLKYQKILIRIINSLNELREKGEDVNGLENRLDKLKSLYMDRRFEEAIMEADELETLIFQLKLKDVLEDKFNKIKETITEAEGLLVDVTDPKQKLSRAEDLRGQGDYSGALDLLVEVQVEIEDMMTKRTFSFIEKEIRDIVNECNSFDIDPGDTKDIMDQAYGLADEERYREAMDLLTGFRDKISKKLMQKKAHVNLEALGKRIKEARPLGINVSSFKASSAKAKVLLDAGDVEKALELVDAKLEEIDAELKTRRQIRSRLDQLRGRLLAQEGRLSRLVKNGVDIGDMDEDVSDIRGLIDDKKLDEAKERISELESRISKLLTRRPEQLKKEMVDTIAEKEDEPRPLSIEVRERGRDTLVKKDEEDEHTIEKAGSEITPEKARSELFILIPKIKTEITRLNSKGIDTEPYKRNIAKVQKMVMDRKYIDALNHAKECYADMTG